MNSKRKAFVEYYLKYWNASKAARKAGYSERTAGSQGQRLLKNVEIKAAIKARLDELQMGTDEVLVRFTEQARGEGAKYIEWDGRINLPKMIEDGKEHLIKKIRVTEKEQTVEFCDSQSALDKVARIHGMYQPEVEMPDVSIQINGFDELLDKVYGSKDEEPDSD